MRAISIAGSKTSERLLGKLYGLERRTKTKFNAYGFLNFFPIDVL